MEAMRAAARALFARPAAEKAALADAAGTLNRGYTPFRSEYNGSTRTERAPADLREGFIFGPFDLPDDPYFAAPGAGFAYQDNIWPSGADGTVAAFKAYYRALEALNVALLGIFADALGLPEPDSSSTSSTATPARSACCTTRRSPSRRRTGALRCGAHTDFGSHTILLADDSPGGLQVRGRDGGWIDVKPPADSFVVNIGDLMMTWTNDRWLSNLHRVANPPAGAATGRLSIAFFAHPNHDASIECIETCRRPGEEPRHPPVLAGDYRHRQVTTITAGAG